VRDGADEVERAGAEVDADPSDLSGERLIHAATVCNAR
jgi:hypothetical protein